MSSTSTPENSFGIKVHERIGRLFFQFAFLSFVFVILVVSLGCTKPHQNEQSIQVPTAEKTKAPDESIKEEQPQTKPEKFTQQELEALPLFKEVNLPIQPIPFSKSFKKNEVIALLNLLAHHRDEIIDLNVRYISADADFYWSGVSLTFSRSASIKRNIELFESFLAFNKIEKRCSKRMVNGQCDFSLSAEISKIPPELFKSKMQDIIYWSDLFEKSFKGSVNFAWFHLASRRLPSFYLNSSSIYFALPFDAMDISSNSPQMISFFNLAKYAEILEFQINYNEGAAQKYFPIFPTGDHIEALISNLKIVEPTLKRFKERTGINQINLGTDPFQQPKVSFFHQAKNMQLTLFFWPEDLKSLLENEELLFQLKREIAAEINTGQLQKLTPAEVQATYLSILKNKQAIAEIIGNFQNAKLGLVKTISLFDSLGKYAPTKERASLNFLRNATLFLDFRFNDKDLEKVLAEIEKRKEKTPPKIGIKDSAQTLEPKPEEPEETSPANEEPPEFGI